jgi:hypothetical protein
VRQLTAVHPPPAVRAGADTTAADRWEGGFAVTAATSLVALFTFQAIDVVLQDLLGWSTSDPGLQFALAFGAASLMWASIVVPAWARRAQAAARTGAAPAWSGPIAGAVLGMVSGYCLPIPGASTVVGLALTAGHLPLLVAGELVIAGAGAGVLAATLAARVATARRRVGALVAAVLTAAVALTTALNVGATVVTAHLRWGSTPEDRLLLDAQGDNLLWRCTPFLLLAGLAVTGRAIHHRRALLPVIAVSGVAGGVAAFLSWQLRWHDGQNPDTTYLLLMQRWWICAFAGAVAALAIWPRLPGERLARLPAALAGGYLTAAVAGLIQFTALAADGFGRNVHNLQESVRYPMWLLFLLTVAGLPWLLLAQNLPVSVPALRLLHGRRRGVTLAGCGIAIGALAVASVNDAFAWLTVAPHDYQRAATAQADFIARAAAAAPQAPTIAAVPAASPSSATLDPGRPLDRVTVARVQDSIEKLLPAHHRLIANNDAPLPDLNPRACHDLLARDGAIDKALPRAARLTRTYTVPAPGTTTSGITVAVTVDSYVTPTDLGGLQREAGRCPRFTTPSAGSDNGRLEFTLSGRPVTVLDYPAYQGDLTATGRVRSLPVVTITSTRTVLIGHNIITADITYSYLALPPSTAVRNLPGQLGMAVISTAITQLRTT